MHTLRWIAALVMLCMSLALAEPLSILYPQEGALRNEGHAAVVVKTATALLDTVEIITDSNQSVHITIDANRSHYCESIALQPGENNVSVRGYKNDALLASQNRTLYYTSPVHKAYRYPPDHYAKAFFHTKEQEMVCASCHDMRVNEVEGVAFEEVSESNCYQCHRKISEKPHGHAPAVNWLCTTCHNGKTGMFNAKYAGKSNYTVPDPIAPVCLGCHKKQKQRWANKRFHHEPADSGRCDKCHNPHASESTFYLRKPAWELCTGCHKDKIAGMHIVKTFTHVMHPTHNVKDPSRPGKELSCTSCHNPHVSNAPSLLQSESVMGLCGRCHKK